MTATGRPRKNRTYSASWWRYIASPSVSASYSDSQSSPRNPLCTKRTVVVPDRPSMVNSSACITPSGPGVPSSAKRCGGSQAVMVDSETSPPNDWRTLPPSLGSTSFGAPIHQPSSCCADGQGVPDLLRRGLDLDGRPRSGTGAACQASCWDVVAACAGTLGWMARRTRCVLPRGAASSWYRPMSAITAADSSSAKAARSAAFANRTSASRANVDSGRRSRAAPVSSVPDVPHESRGERQQPHRRAVVGRPRRVRLRAPAARPGR